LYEACDIATTFGTKYAFVTTVIPRNQAGQDGRSHYSAGPSAKFE